MSESQERFHVFPYREEEPRVGAPAIPRPTVNLRLTNFDDEARIDALVDTGAPFCVFDRAVAELLAIDMGLGRGKSRTVRILGDVYDARVAMVTLDLPPFEGLSWETEVAFLYAELDLSFAGVLGQEGFLDRWAASFNLAHNYFVIEESDAMHARVGPALDADRARQSPQHSSEWDRPGPS